MEANFRDPTSPHRYFGAVCLDVRTLAFSQLLGFSFKPLKVKLLAGEQKATKHSFPQGVTGPATVGQFSGGVH